MSTYFFDKTLTIRRLKELPNDRQAYSATFTSFELSLQPIGDERLQESEGYIGREYFLYVDLANPITEGDQAVVNGKTYNIKSVAVFDGPGSLTHKRLKGVQKTGDV